jgi:hypothetical protein
MKTVIYFVITLCISCGCMIAATNTKNPLPLFIAAFGIWVPFFWGWHRRLKKEADRRANERLFEEYMRSKIYNDRKHRARTFLFTTCSRLFPVGRAAPVLPL